MNAVVYTRYGSPDVLEFKNLVKPSPKENEVLVKIYAAAVNAADWHFLRGKPFLVRLMGYGLLKPKKNILGLDIAGRVEEVGRNVKQFKPGDDVFGDIGSGGFAEYASATEDRLVLKPANATFEEAAAVPVSALTALQGLRNIGKIQAGQKVLINGASGGVGTFSVQIAKSFGAEVTGVCSTSKMEMVRSIGADHVIDYTKEDFTKNGMRYDLILAANGYHSISDYKRALSLKGICVVAGGSGAQMLEFTFAGPFVSMTGSKKMTGVMAKPDKNDLLFLKELLEAGKIKPVIDRRYQLSEVANAIRYIEEGHAIGKVIITIV